MADVKAVLGRKVITVNMKNLVKIAKEEQKTIETGSKDIVAFECDCTEEPKKNQTCKEFNGKLKNELEAIAKDYLAWLHLPLVPLVTRDAVDDAFVDVFYAVYPQHHIKLLNKATDTNKLSDYNAWIKSIGLEDISGTDTDMLDEDTFKLNAVAEDYARAIKRHSQK